MISRPEHAEEISSVYLLYLSLFLTYVRKKYQKRYDMTLPI